MSIKSLVLFSSVLDKAKEDLKIKQEDLLAKLNNCSSDSERVEHIKRGLMNEGQLNLIEETVREDGSVEITESDLNIRTQELVGRREALAAEIKNCSGNREKEDAILEGHYRILGKLELIYVWGCLLEKQKE